MQSSVRELRAGLGQVREVKFLGPNQDDGRTPHAAS